MARSEFSDWQMSDGSVVQMVHGATTAVATGSTLTPYDDTIPQITEGDEYMTQTITPTNTNNKLIIQVVCQVSPNAAKYVAVALFQDATANALASQLCYALASHILPISLTYSMTAGTTSATTFRVRAGPHAASTVTLNGVGGARKHGGVMESTITIWEIKV